MPDPMTPKVPTTAASGRFIELLRQDCPWFIGGSFAGERELLAAIEAEAAAAALAKAAEAVRGLSDMHTHGVACAPIPVRLGEFRAAVLAILEGEPRRSCDPRDHGGKHAPWCAEGEPHA